MKKLLLLMLVCVLSVMAAMGQTVNCGTATQTGDGLGSVDVKIAPCNITFPGGAPANAVVGAPITIAPITLASPISVSNVAVDVFTGSIIQAALTIKFMAPTGQTFSDGTCLRRFYNSFGRVDASLNSTQEQSYVLAPVTMPAGTQISIEFDWAIPNAKTYCSNGCGFNGEVILQ